MAALLDPLSDPSLRPCSRWRRSVRQTKVYPDGSIGFVWKAGDSGLQVFEETAE
jgi:hypothetical protein